MGQSHAYTPIYDTALCSSDNEGSLPHYTSTGAYSLTTLLGIFILCGVSCSRPHHSGTTRPRCHDRSCTCIIDHYGHDDLHIFPAWDLSTGHYYYATWQPTISKNKTYWLFQSNTSLQNSIVDSFSRNSYWHTFAATESISSSFLHGWDLNPHLMFWVGKCSNHLSYHATLLEKSLWG